MNEKQYLSRISQLENEIEYLHGLLDDAGISYKREAKELDDLSPDRNLAFEEDQGTRILPATITKQHIQYYGVSDKPSANSIMTALHEAIEVTNDCKYRRTFHSDRGWAYQMKAYGYELKKNKIFQSMSRKGN